MKNLYRKAIQHNVNSKRQAGVTMVEALVWVGIASGVILGVLTMYSSYQEKKMVNDFVQNSTELSASIKSSFREVDRNYANLTSTAAIDAKAVPDKMIIGGSILNSWGGAVTLSSIDYNGTDDAFTIASAQIPQTECMRASEKLADVFLQYDINSTTVKSATVAPSSSAITAACSNATNNTITMTYQ